MLRSGKSAAELATEITGVPSDHPLFPGVVEIVEGRLAEIG